MAKILLVDDDPHVSRIMNMWLTRHGYEVLVASNGAEALGCVRDGNVDMIVSDLNMPVMDGADMVRALRGEGLSELPVILLTARCERDSLTKELGPLGVTIYPKPFVPSRLVREVQQRLGNPQSDSGQAGDNATPQSKPSDSMTPAIQEH